MTKQAQRRIEAIETAQKRESEAMTNPHLSSDVRNKAALKWRELQTELDNLKSGNHWLTRQTTTSNKIVYAAVQNALRRAR